MGFLATTLILLVSSVAWSAEPTEKVSVCISCHLEMGGDFALPVTLWQKSIHRQMGNSCEGCHGGDPADAAAAMDPEKGFVGAPTRSQVADFCGKCHVGVKENYVQSRHFLASESGPTCITCHNSHDVQKASFDLIQKSLCSRCHSFENGEKMKRAFVGAEMAFLKKTEEIERFERRGMPVKRLEEKLFALRNSLHQMTHTLDVQAVQQKTTAALQEMEEMETTFSEFRKKIRRRWWGGTAVAVFLAVLIVVLWRLHETYEEEE